MPEYSVAKCDMERQKNDILGVLKRNFAQQWDALFAWKYEQCPVDDPVCFLAKDEDSGAYIGTSSAFPRHMLVNGRRVRASIAVVSRKYVSYGKA